MTTQKEKARRLAIVEQAIQERGWSLRLQEALAKKFGVNQRTIRKYKADLIELMKTELGEDRETVRGEFLTRLRGHQRTAADRGKDGAVSSMLALEADLVGLRDRGGNDGKHVVEIRVNTVPT